MKKALLIFAVALMAGLSVASCAKPDNNQTPGEEQNQGGGDTPGGEGGGGTQQDMGHVGQGTLITKSGSGKISGTPYSYSLFVDGGTVDFMYYDNGTFEGKWSKANDCLASVGFIYDEGVDADKHHYALDYNFSKMDWGDADYGYSGVYGWTVDPLVNFWIVDDFVVTPGSWLKKSGSFDQDGETYDIYYQDGYGATPIPGMPSSSFKTIFSVRSTKRNKGHIDVNAHLAEWKKCGLILGKILFVTCGVDGGSDGSSSHGCAFDCVHMSLTDNAE